MTKTGFVFSFGLSGLLLFVWLLSGVQVTTTENERYISLACGKDHPQIYPKPGIYWKDCSKPKLLFNL